MNGRGFRRYLPLAIAIAIVVAFVLLAYIAGYRAGRASVSQSPVIHRTTR